MASLVWDKVGDRFYETGLDKGVLYLNSGLAVPWNGLVEVSEKFDKESTPIYYDGLKISDHVSLGDFSATMKAMTYPDEFLDIEGYGFLRQGMFVGNQLPQTFSLSYRTRIGNDIEGDSLGYKIHILYNLTAIPNDRTYTSISDSPNIIEFEWDIVSVPVDVPGFRPTAHIIINSVDLEPQLLTFIEEKLYGTQISDPALISIADLISYMYTWALMEIVDNGNGTWTAITKFDEDLSIDEVEQIFTLVNANAEYSDADTYKISNVVESSDIT
jgi:hypothetical protein